MKELYYGDNLIVMRKHMKDESVDLIYLDPPFNSKRDYNVLFKDQSGKMASSQMVAFKDTWHWNDAEVYYDEIMLQGGQVAKLINAMVDFLGRNSLTSYLVMIAIRLQELHRILKSTGSIYLHCDPTASHYLKILMDAVFGASNFRNEIVWSYSTGGLSKKWFGRKHDIILFYSKSNNYVFNQPRVESKSPERFNLTDIDGRKYYIKAGNKYYLDNGVTLTDSWCDLSPVRNVSKERLGYPTQKPIALLERIVKASSNPGDIVFDPFCGCGTTIASAENLNRKWIGVDITHLAVNVQKERLKKFHGLTQGKDYQVHGEPQNVDAAWQLFKDDPYQFQWWAIDMIGGKPYQDGKKGADGGIDGFINQKYGKEWINMLIQVKGGKNANVSQIRDLAGTVKREKAKKGIFICFKATKPMLLEALNQGKSKIGLSSTQLIEILTIEDLLNGKKIEGFRL